MRPARCWWAICDCDPHRAASPSPQAGHLLRAEAGRGQASCGAGLCRGPAPCSPVQPGKVGPCLPAYHHLFTEELTSSSLEAHPRSRSQNSNPELDTTPRLPAVLFLASVSPSVKSEFLAPGDVKHLNPTVWVKLFCLNKTEQKPQGGEGRGGPWVL